METIEGAREGTSGDEKDIPLPLHDLEPALEDFRTAVIAGLSQNQKTLPCKFFYDERGSQLFDRICELDEYYPTRTEIALLDHHSDDIARLFPPGSHLVEFGSGSSIKIRILLDSLRLAAYTAVDISREHLIKAASALSADFPDIEINAVCADYTQPFDIPVPDSNPDALRIGFFPGSTIGNFLRSEAETFLTRAARLLAGGGMIIGVDLKKDPAILRAAYNDRDGVTAAFNLNLLERINRELGADFDVSAFTHDAVYNDREGRVEMHLVSQRRQSVTIGESTFRFEKGETIHTENSHKYSIDEFEALARRAGFEPAACWTDAEDLFSLHYLRTAAG